LGLLVAEEIGNPTLVTLENRWLPFESSSRHISPDSEQTNAWVGDIEVTAVNVPSSKEPSKQFRPGRIRCMTVDCCEAKNPANALTGVPTGVDTVDPSGLQTLTCLVPTVIRLVPIQVI
jgi:hypothetical protein